MTQQEQLVAQALRRLQSPTVLADLEIVLGDRLAKATSSMVTAEEDNQLRRFQGRAQELGNLLTTLRAKP